MNDDRRRILNPIFLPVAAIALLAACSDARERLPEPTGPGSIVATVEDQTGSPVEGVPVQLQPGDVIELSDAFGTAFFRDIEPGVYIVTAEHAELGSARATVNLKGQGLEEPVLVLGGPTVDGAPEVTITSPSNGSSVGPMQAVVLSGSLRDDRDQPTRLQVEWRSSIDGVLARPQPDWQGNTLPIDVELSVGQHRISLSATDSEGKMGSATVTVTVGSPEDLPDPVVLAPLVGDSNGVDLSWSRSVEPEAFEYRVHRAEDGANFEVVAVIDDANQTTYRDTTARLAVTYTYRVGVRRRSDGLEGLSNLRMISVGDFIDVASQVETMLVDPGRPYLYALDRVNNSLHFVDLRTNEVLKTVFVGSSPVDMDISLDGTELYIANFGSTEIAVVDLELRERTRSIFVDVEAGSWDGNPYRLACTTGTTVVFTSEDQWVDLKLVDATTGLHIAHSGSVYQPDLAANADGTRVYVGESGSSGSSLIRFDVTPTGLTQVDESGRASGYGSRNVVLSGDDRYAFYGGVKFLASNLSSQLGTFSEIIWATNGDGSLAFGAENIYDGTTFAVLRPMPLETRVMALATDETKLYLYDETSSRIFVYDVSDL